MRLLNLTLASLAILGAACTGSESDGAAPLDSTTEATPVLTSTTASTVAGDSTSAPEPVSPESTAPTANDRSSEVLALAVELGVSRLVVSTDEHQYLWSDGALAIRNVDDMAWLWADDAFAYWYTSTEDPVGVYNTSTIVRDYAGEVVCDLDDFVHHVTQRADGSYVAGVERRTEEFVDAHPMFAIDCSTKAEQPIAPINFRDGETETRSILRVGGRTFEVHGDAEGNANVLSEDAVSINGDDYAGYHVFNADGSQVAYGDMRQAIHVSWIIISRDTTSGKQLWRTELELPFNYLGFAGNDTVASQPSEFDPGAEPDTASVLVLDGATGQILKTIDTTLDIIYTS